MAGVEAWLDEGQGKGEETEQRGCNPAEVITPRDNLTPETAFPEDLRDKIKSIVCLLLLLIIRVL